MDPVYNVAVIGGGPAGMMAAIRAAELVPGVALFEKNASLGRKLSLTGKGRCNLTHDAPEDDFIAAFGKNGLFLRQAFSRFFVDDLKRFFEERGCALKTERQARVFPASDNVKSVSDVLKKALETAGVKVCLNAAVSGIADKGDFKKIRFSDGKEVRALKVIVATGGLSYPQTGSTGDGYQIAESLGHRLVALLPGLVPLETQESFVKDLQGLALKNIRIVFDAGSKKIESAVGELLFTHFGISGPLVLDLSAGLAVFLNNNGIKAYIDLKPGLDSKALDVKLQNEFQGAGSGLIKNYLKTLLPARLIDVILRLSEIDSAKKCHQITAPERKRLIAVLKSLPLTVKKTRPLREAMVTCGGVSLKEINPETMESKKIKGLYFCGEILDVAAPSGGYNLQAAFSTGFIAGESSAKSLSRA